MLVHRLEEEAEAASEDFFREVSLFETVDELLEAYFPEDPRNKMPEFKCPICPEEPWIPAASPMCTTCGTDFELPDRVFTETRPEQERRLES